MFLVHNIFAGSNLTIFSKKENEHLLRKKSLLENFFVSFYYYCNLIAQGNQTTV